MPQPTANNNTSAQLNLPHQTGGFLTKSTPLPIDVPAAEAALTASKNLNSKYIFNNLLSYKMWLAFLFSLLILITAFFTYDTVIANAQVSDVDPEDMQLLFAEFTKRINLLRNPRKILRFKNKVKYHYYFLKKGGVRDMASLRKMVLLLFEINNDPSLISTENISPERLSDATWFYDVIKLKPWFATLKINLVADNELMMVILKLNVDMGA